MRYGDNLGEYWRAPLAGLSAVSFEVLVTAPDDTTAPGEGLRKGCSDCRSHHSDLPSRGREQVNALVARHREYGYCVWSCGGLIVSKARMDQEMNRRLWTALKTIARRWGSN